MNKNTNTSEGCFAISISVRLVNLQGAPSGKIHILKVRAYLRIFFFLTRKHTRCDGIGHPVED